MWLLALYVTRRRRSRAPPLRALAGTTQNDIVKEYLSRGTYIFPPGAVAAADHRHRSRGRWRNCSEVEPGQHLLVPPAGGRRDARAGGRLRAGHRGRRARRGARLAARCRPSAMGDVVRGSRSSSTPACGSSRRWRRCARSRALWDELTARPVRRHRRQAARGSATACRSTRSGLTEAQPENNVQRIVLEMLGVTLSRDARARAVQLPAWNEALGLPRPWDQQWSLRMQQVLAYESDLLEYPDLFDGSHVVDGARRRPSWTVRGAELDTVLELGGVGRRRRVRLPQERAGRLAGRAPAADRVRRGRGGRRQPVHRDRAVAADRRRRRGRSSRSTRPSRRRPSTRVAAWRADRDAGRGRRGARPAARRRRGDRRNLMPATLACVRAGVTTGEWAGALREVFGEYRAPTGLSAPSAAPAQPTPSLAGVRERVARDRRRAGRRPAAAAGRQARAWTGTPTAPSRSRCAPATPASRWSTRASG